VAWRVRWDNGYGEGLKADNEIYLQIIFAVGAHTELEGQTNS
jgi:hypothetical protein